MTKTQLLDIASKNGATVKKSWAKGKIQGTLIFRLMRSVAAIESTIAHHQKHSKSYMWGGDNGNSASRRVRGNELSFTVVMSYNGVEYSYESAVTISRANFYYKGYFCVDGERKDLRAWRKLIKLIEADLEAVRGA